MIISLSLSFATGGFLASIFWYFKVQQKNSQLIFDKDIIEGLKLQVEKAEVLQNQLMQARIDLSALSAENNQLINHNAQKSKELEELQVRLAKDFEIIANKVIVNQSQKLGEQNTARIDDLLKPLKEKIVSFEKKVEDTYDKELRDKMSLREEVKRLSELNHKISEDAENLTQALKGNVKRMGNWGEMILERILEQSGLTLGREYRREVTDVNAEQKRIRPDVIIDLPENKHLIIDSKLSLVAFERYVNAKSQEEQTLALKQHKESLKAHINGLFEKNYSSAQSINSPDFVLMFIPIEASFSVVIEADNELFAYAWERKIVLVSPSTLLATLKTISSIWKHEQQSRNAVEIAKQSGALYDKLVGFINDFEKINFNIAQAQKSYEAAKLKLQTGRGNVISKAEKIRELGAKNSKTLPEDFILEED